MARGKKKKLEFFDREYTAREAYGRLWRYARRYWFRLSLGVVCGMLTAGTLVPMFSLVQPTLAKVERREDVKSRNEKTKGDIEETRNAGKVDKKACGILGHFDEFQGWAAKFGIEMQDEDEALGLPLLFVIVVLMPLLVLIRCGLVFLNHYCLAWAGMKTVRDIRYEISHCLTRQSLQFYGRVDVGRLMLRSTSDPRHVQFIVQNVLQEIAQAPFEIAVSVGFIILTAVQNDMVPILLLLAVGCPLFLFPVVMLSKRIRKWSRKALERFSVVGSRIHEILTCVRTVKAYNTELFEERRYREVNDQTLQATLRSLRWGLLVGPTVETAGIFLLCAFLVWCFLAHVKLSAIMPMLAPLLIAYKPIKQLSKLQVQIEQGRAALARIWSLMDVHMELPETSSKFQVPSSKFEERIVFEDVSFRYDTAEQDAISHASFEIPHGKTVAVVGSTGSGKSTLSGLLARFFDPREGRILMDGSDLRDFRIADLRKLIGTVQQETLLFNDTIEENIKYGSPEATRAEVVAAAKMANAHDFIMSQPEGYARMCGEKGFALSGGERQRIAIARAILRDPPILILDEATSALDTVTEKLVQDALNNVMKNRTVFAIAHRLSTIRSADLILVMDRGRIVERGTHDELYARDGVYRKLCDMQATSVERGRDQKELDNQEEPDQ